MQRWFRLEPEQSNNGQYTLLCLRSQDGRAAEDIPEFLSQLADLMLGYVSKENPSIQGRFDAYYTRPSTSSWLPRAAVERLLASENALKGFTGECLAHWLYQSFDPPLLMTEPKVFSADPAWDLLRILDIAGPVAPFRLACVQSKVTSGYARDSCDEAVEKYKKLHEGMYDAELVNEISMWVREETIRPHFVNRDWRVVLSDASQREYAIFLAYDGPAPNVHDPAWAQRWRTYIDTASMNRALIVLPLSKCHTFMSRLASEIRAKAI